MIRTALETLIITSSVLCGGARLTRPLRDLTGTLPARFPPPGAGFSFATGASVS